MTLDLITVLFHCIQQALTELAALQVAADGEDRRLLPLRCSQTSMENTDNHINSAHHDNGNSKRKRQDPPQND